ncbi:MAG TPA: pitrilysin family protein [Acidobacteriaceae bacterium]|nr:pitrilysin family protein [Acidobacteriaceae bacterium]
MTRIMRLAAFNFAAFLLLPLTAFTQTAAKSGAQSAAKPAGAVTPAAAKSPGAEPWKSISIPPLHEFKPKQPKRIELSNGLVIFLQEDHELPFIDGTILIRGGSRDVPSDKVGLVSMYGESWRTSGSTSKPGDVLDNELAAKAASIETGGGTATTSLNWGSFKQDFDTVFADAIDLLLHPDFKADKLTLAKRQVETAISRRNDNPDAIAVREATKIVYGPTNPYGRQAEYSTVDAVTLDDFKSWHDRTIAPNNMIVAVGGDFDSAEMEQKLRKVFEPMQRGDSLPELHVDFPGPKPGVYFANKEDVNQTTVEIVGLGTERNNPDFYALTVMNEIFSGGFGSRLVQSVRTRLGLAYDVGGAFGAQYDHPGVFRSEAGTKSASTVDATKAVLDEISKLKTNPPTPAEMAKAKDQVMNSFIFNYDTPEKILNEQVVLAFYGYPPDYLEKFRAGIERVTAADVTRVAQKYIEPSKLAVVVVGNKAEIQPPLSALGPVTNLDITIPPPPGGAGTPGARGGNPGAGAK